MNMSEPAVDGEDLKSLINAIQRREHDFVVLNDCIRELHDELQNKCDQNVKDHQMQLDRRLELLKRLQFLVAGTNSSVAEFQDKPNEAAGDTDRPFVQQLHGLQDYNDQDFTLPKLERLMTWQYERMKDLARSHGRLLLQERDMLQQLQNVHSDKSLALSQLQAKLDKSETESAERENQLSEANRRLHQTCEQLQKVQAESDDRANKLDEANKRLRKELMNCQAELQTSRELDFRTKLRMLEDFNMNKEDRAIISRLIKDAASTVKQLEKHGKATATRYSEDADENVELEQTATRGSSLPDFLQQLQKKYQQLTVRLEAKKVAALMFQHNALTFKELQTVQQCTTDCKAAEDLLQIIMKLSDQQVYNCFLSALQETNQRNIWSWLSYDDYDIESEHVQLIQSHYSYLVETIDTQTTGLLNHLFANLVVDTRDKDQLNAESSEIQRNEKLLSIMRRKEKEQFDLFMECLCETGQRHVVNKLLRGEESLDETEDGPERPSNSSEMLSSGSAEPTAKNSISEVAECQSDFGQVQCSLRTTVDVTPDLTLCHVIYSSDGRGGEVRGITVCDEKLFVLRGPSKERIQQYAIESYTELPPIDVKQLSDRDLGCKTLTSCMDQRCLYLNDHSTVFGVNISNNNISSWHVAGEPCGLSVSRTGYILVTCRVDNVIKEFSANGSDFRLFKSIPLPNDHVTSPLHAVQLDNKRYVVCHYGPRQGISLIDHQGKLIATYGNSETTQQVNYPRSIVVINESILVADRDNDRLILLDSSLSDARVLCLPVDCQLKQPCCMYFDKSQRRLYVGEHGGEKRVVVFGNVNF